MKAAQVSGEDALQDRDPGEADAHRSGLASDRLPGDSQGAVGLCQCPSCFEEQRLARLREFDAAARADEDRAAHRFIDRVERRNGVCRIADRKSVYDFAPFTFPTGAAEIDSGVVARYPRAYGAPAYLLATSGFPLVRTFATKGGELSRTSRHRRSPGSAKRRARNRRRHETAHP